MQPIDIMFKTLAIIGALSWLPQLFILLRYLIIKPKLIIITEDELEIGYTTFGPIINTRIAFLSKNKKSLIEKIEVELMHENNDTQTFKWKWFEETLHVMDLPDHAGSLPTKKNQTAIAINILKDELVEKKLGFQQNTFQNTQKQLEQLMFEEALNYYTGGRKSEELKSSKNYNDLNDLYQNSFNWKVGKYSIKFKVYINDSKRPFVKDVVFNMSALDIKMLKMNIEKCLSEVERIYINSELVVPNWNWVNRKIEDK